MAATQCKITDHQTWGRYLSIYTVYRIDVFHKGIEWFVFRRFSEFKDLQKMFMSSEELRPLAEPLMELLPATDAVSYLGSAVATLDSVTSERFVKFSLYLDAVLQEKKLRKSRIFLGFIDEANKGISGIKRILGVEQVAREDFIMCSQGRLAKFGFNSWKRSYICLTTKGWLYMTACIYDTPDECDCKIDLKSKKTRIGGDASACVLHANYDDSVNIFAKFNSSSGFSSWLRQLSDFGINSAQQEALTEPPKEQKERRNSAPKTHLRAAGTGRTKDDMSSSYGI